jgi:hypothetical protein
VELGRRHRQEEEEEEEEEEGEEEESGSRAKRPRIGAHQLLHHSYC